MLMLNIMIVSIASVHGLDPSLLKAVCYHETKLVNVNHEHDGRSTSYGICQLKRVAARQVGFPKADLSNVQTNLRVAAKYLVYNLNRCGSSKSALAAYNTGHCIARPKKGGYVDQVLKYEKQFKYNNRYVLNN